MPDQIDGHEDDASYDAIDDNSVIEPSPEEVEIMRLEQVKAWEAATAAVKDGQ